MNDDELYGLEREVKLANHAKSAYDLYLKKFIDDQKHYCYTQFEEIHCNEIEDLQTIKYLLDSVIHLENSIKSDIETGKLAQMQLQKGV
jgi:hypothetical protein